MGKRGGGGNQGRGGGNQGRGRSGGGRRGGGRGYQGGRGQGQGMDFALDRRILDLLRERDPLVDPDFVMSVRPYDRPPRTPILSPPDTPPPPRARHSPHAQAAPPSSTHRHIRGAQPRTPRCVGAMCAVTDPGPLCASPMFPLAQRASPSSPAAHIGSASLSLPPECTAATPRHLPSALRCWQLGGCAAARLTAPPEVWPGVRQSSAHPTAATGQDHGALPEAQAGGRDPAVERGGAMARQPRVHQKRGSIEPSPRRRRPAQASDARRAPPRQGRRPECCCTGRAPRRTSARCC